MNNFHMREGKVEFRWKRWRNKKRQEVSSCLMVLFSGAVLLGAGGVAVAGPTGGQVTGGQGTITNPNGTTTNINQQSNVLNINWQDFSIGAGETVNFYQPGSTSIAINRVVGGVPSYLAGALNANGRVFILNSAGITFTGTSQVNVGALLATTAMTVNGDPTQAASYSGTGYGAVINQGSISVSNGGFAILAAPYVQNTGFIKADLGTIALAGTNQFTLDLSGTGLINFVVPAGAVEQIVSDGKAVGVDNSGTLQARSGQVVISANVASEVINAVVNLNGIVDADAFAPNGQGGAVLVSAAGDVNVGGQVTARGNGSGAGGQIVTKAVGDDLIGQMAYVSAAGGVAGKGGFIEVSGKQVGLHGTIDPGSGGSLYIDPNNIHVIAANGGVGTLVGSNQTGSTIGSDFIENELHAGANVNLVADHNVFFDVLADDHQLVGGNGNLNIVAASGNITFAGTNDAIVQGAGFIHMNANGGNIGSSGHAMTLITGVNNTAAGAGVTQAGDIVLKATDDIHVHKVQVKSSGGSSFTAKFSASAGHNFIASGDINVQAVAHGVTAQTADATVNIFAHNNISLHNVTDLALANQISDTHSSDAHALANLKIHASESITVAGAILDRAFASDAGDGDAQANAQADILAGNNITVRNVDVKATANQHDNDGSSALACANLQMHAGSSDFGVINVNGNIRVQANARAAGSNSANAAALADITAGSSIGVGGDVDVTANANQLSSSGEFAEANANLQMHAGSSSTGVVNVQGDIGVHASAQAHGDAPGFAEANALADITAGSSIGVGGDVDVTANANQLSSSGEFAEANANLQMHAGFSSTGVVNVQGDIGVHASAQAHGDAPGFAEANALADITAGSSIGVGGDVDVTANANQLSSSGEFAEANANLQMHAGFSSTGVVNVQGDIGVHASAQAHGDAPGFAEANALADITAGSSIGVGGDVDVTANANQLSSSGEFAEANANLQMHAGSSSTGVVNVQGDIGVHASAQAHGDAPGFAEANALADITAGSSIGVGGDVDVTANANQLSSSGEFAEANANLQMHAGSSSTGVVNVQGDIGVHASAQAHGDAPGFAEANALADITAGSSIGVGGDVDVTANANQLSSSGEFAEANANLQMHAGFSSTGVVNVQGDIGVHASAQAHGDAPGFAEANALADITAGSSIGVGGDVDVTANANQLSSSGEFAEANANLQMHAGFSSTGVVNVQGDIGVHASAQAHGNDGGFAEANALADITAGSSIGVGGDVDVTANANQLSSSGEFAEANANLQMHAGSSSLGVVNVSGDIGVQANARASGTGFADANALADITAGSSIKVGGNVEAHASANQNGTQGSSAHACANVSLDPSVEVNVNGDVKASANAFSKGSESAVANAAVHMNISGDVTVNGVVTANAHAVADSTNSAAPNNGALALASIDVNGDPVTLGGVDEHATATSHGSINQANALANAHLHGASDLLVHGDVTVFAKALDDSTASGKGAVANAHLVANAGELLSIDGVNVTASANYAGQSHAYDASAFASLEGSRVVVGDTIVKSRASGHGASGLSKATLLVTDSSFIHMTGSINVEADLVGSGFSPIGATALASLNGNSITVDGRTRVVAMTTGSHAGLGSVFANALLNVNATKNVHFGSSIDVEALVNGSDAHGFNAHPVVQVNASSLEVDGNLKVLANANGASANSVIAAPTLNLDNVGQVVTNGIELDAFAHGHAVKLILANAVLIDSGHANFTDHGLTKVFAKASGSSASTIQADATLQVNVPNNASFGGGIDVVASAFGITSFSSHGAKAIVANAIANIQANNHLTIGDDLTVTALASGNTATKVTAQALGRLRGSNGVDLTTGNIDVAATANGGSRVSFGTAAAVASLDILAANGGVHLGGDVEVAANVSYQPNSSATINGIVIGNAFALANAAVFAGNGDVTVDGNIGVIATLLDKSNSLGSFFTVPGFGQTGDEFLPQSAIALLNIGAHNGDVTLKNVAVTANVQLNASESGFDVAFSNAFAGAIALANIIASSGSVEMGAVDVEATMNAPTLDTFGFKLGVVGALAALNVQAGSDISAGPVTVEALANVGVIETFDIGSGAGTPFGIGDAVAIANFSAGDSVEIDGDVKVEASYNGVLAQHGIVVAALHVNASSGAVSIDGNVTVDGTLQLTGKFGPFGTPESPPPSDEAVFANALIQADSSVRVAGDVDVTANVQGNSVKFTAFGQAAALLTGSSVEVGGNVDVEALTNVTSANSVIADARAGLFGFFGVEVDGSVTVKATAHHGNPSFTGTESGVVISKAVFTASADDSSVHIGHGVTVTANTLEEGSEDGLAFAEASANIFGRFGVSVGGTVTVRADLTDFADNGSVLPSSADLGPFGSFHYSGAGGLASAQVHIQDEFSAGVSLGGLTVTANATTLNPEFDGNASAFASAEVISSHGPINIAGSVVGRAHANDQGDGGALAVTLIDLEPAASFATTTASLHIGGGVTMKALAELGTMAEGNAMAVAVLNADADSGAVRIDGNVNILANARILSTPSTPDILIYPFGQAAAYANANLEGASGVSVGGGIAVTAKLRSKTNFDQSSIEFALGDNDSFSVEWGHAAAIAQLEASNGGIAVGGVTVASASAVGRGFDDTGTVAATAEVDMEAQGNIRVGGALTRAFASGTDESNASANANTKLNATSGSINAGPGGLTATAIALASNATHANAQANVAADASSNIFIRGNVISFALAVSGGSGNTAHAKTHLAAGGATSSFSGGSFNFGNIVVIGNIGAFAFADATNDEATASVEIFAHNNLLIVGNDPIASARVGPSGGTTFAFRQAHFTTHDGTNFGPGGGALADIDIRAGGFISVFPASSLTHVEKLYSLPTDDPTLNSSLGLTIIPLSVDGEDCGVLGIAGKDQAAINKALGCHHKPINVSDLTDTGP